VADAPWRCSQCGTVNEPVANACRTCGRWPSLFELEGNSIESDAPTEIESGELYEPEPLEVEDVEPEAYDMGQADEPDEDATIEARDEVESAKPPWRRLARLIVPIGVVLYLLISSLANRGG
jgi:hypothetical protein